MPKRMLKFLSIVAFVLSVSATCSAQATPTSTASPSTTSATSQDDDVLRLLEVTKIKLDAAEAKAALLEQRLSDKDSTIAAHEHTIAILEEQKKLLAEAGQTRAQVNTGDERLLNRCDSQLDAANAEIQRLRHPGFLRSLFDTRRIEGVAIGYALPKR